jgi:hypothetical protein
MIAVAALAKAMLLAPLFLALAEPGTARFSVAAWIPVLPAGAILPVWCVWMLAGVAFLLGWHTRWAGGALFVALVCVLSGDQQLYSNHLYLLATIVGLFTLLETGWVARPILLLRLQVSIVYGFAALAKVNVAYLSGAVLNIYIGHGSVVPFPDGLRVAVVMAPLAWLSIIGEGMLATGFWLPRWRMGATVLGVLMHVGMVLFLGTPLALAVFAVMMFALYVLHLPAPEKPPTSLDAPGVLG